MKKSTKIFLAIAIVIIIVIIIVMVMKKKKAGQVETTSSTTQTSGLAALTSTGGFSSLIGNFLGGKQQPDASKAVEEPADAWANKYLNGE